MNSQDSTYGLVEDILLTLSRTAGNICHHSNDDVENQTESEYRSNSFLGDGDTIACILWKNANLGVAYYKISEKHLYILNDMIDFQPSFIITKTIMEQIHPLHVLTIGNMVDDFTKCLIEILTEEEISLDSDSIRTLPPNLKLLHSKEYLYSSCEYKILNIRLPSEPENATEDQREIYIHSLVDFKNKLSVYALGALIKYLETNWGNIISNNQHQLSFNGINSVTMENQVFLDKNTYKALRIFKEETHDSGFKRGAQTSNREGYSLYKLLSQHCKSCLGYICARQILQCPTNDINELNKRLDFLEFVINPANNGFIKGLQDNIKKLSDINWILDRIQYSRASSSDWQTLYNTIYHTLFIHELCRPYSNSSAVLSELESIVTANLYSLEKCINSALDFKHNQKKKRPVIKFGLDGELDAKKLQIRDICNTVTTAANFTIDRLSPYVKECVVIYVPESGYMVAIKEWESNCNKYQLEEELGYQFMFELKGILHYKNAMCKELDHHLGDIHLDVIAHENRICQRLSGFVMKHNKEIRDPLKFVAQIDLYSSGVSQIVKYGTELALRRGQDESDESKNKGVFRELISFTSHFDKHFSAQFSKSTVFRGTSKTIQNELLEYVYHKEVAKLTLISMAIVAKEKGYIRPKLNEDNIHVIKECKHPLLEGFYNNYVCNDFYSGGSHSRIKIITGPNASGKSVYLKQLGLLIYMAHIGSFLPAQEANIGMTLSIHSRIHTTESAALRLSSLMIDLTQMAQALTSAKPNSLIMIDEFGRGTTGIEGLSLQAGALKKFCDQNDFCPHIVVSTHMQQLTVRIPVSSLVSHMKMNHTIEKGEIIYLYKLIIGVSESFALEVAATAGLDPDIINRAAAHLNTMRSNRITEAHSEPDVIDDDLYSDIQIPQPDDYPTRI